ncbi:hypothetical protein M2401_000940 [Pseudomonas sp. JUb42]|uniref:hypothetical protein n=1 Tax=Pseudomonas sp. JUb42 TaxID=2940611 RepID=UPI0021694D8D|nr:hypothetical protein [Pseudomonas sp. JUb42]MCS3467219.1 hypothetical protein [Pseudomonas sp. JUb42]
MERMRRGSVTQGWGAVAAFSRSKLNHLLEQQFIERFQHLSFFPFFMGEVALDDRRTHVARLSRIELGAPLLSFITASMQDSRALLTMNIVSGAYAVEHQSAGVSTEIASVLTITEPMGYRLEMQIDLSMVVGEIDRRGKVHMDLAKAVSFRCNLAGPDLDDPANRRLADFFAAEFKTLSPDRSVFQLGMLDFKSYNELSPTRFRVLTQAADGSRVRGAKNFGDGAVVVFIRLRANTGDGNYPPAGDFPFLIPNDQVNGADKYSASLVLSEEMLGYVGEDPPQVVNSLLFPGANKFEKVEQHTPRDLAIFGNIAPTQTSYRLEPSFKSIKAGQTQTFTLRDWQGQAVQASSWQAVSLQSHSAEGHGSISNGLYSAPSATIIGRDTLRVMITATYNHEGRTHTVLALLLVAFDEMVVAPRVATSLGGSQARPLSLSASMLAGGAVSWALRGAEYGELSEVGTGAVFTPDARSGRKGLLVQQVEAQGVENQVVSLLLINSQQQLRVDPPYVPRLGRSTTVQLQDDSSLLPGLERRWKVIGGGGSVDEQGLFTTAADGISASSVVSCEIVRNGVVFASGYSVVDVSEVIEEPTWEELAMFIVQVPGGQESGKRGELYANGYQQLRVKVSTQTMAVDGVYYALSPLEQASMRLAEYPSGNKVDFLDGKDEGIAEDLEGERAWRVNLQRNRFDLAGSNVASGQLTNAPPPPLEQIFYLHTRHDPNSSQDFEATFQADRTLRWHNSTDYTDQHAKITVTPKRPPNYEASNYHFDLKRVSPLNGPNGEPSPEPPSSGPEDDPFDLELQTIDYWKLGCKHPDTNESMNFMTLEFLPESDNDAINTSMILWESEQMAEIMFSWTGYIFREIKKESEEPVPPPLKISFDDAIKDVVRNESLDIDVHSSFEQGKLVISLHRSDRIPYIRSGNAARDKLSKSLIVLLRDQQGNAHCRKISFRAGSTGERNRLMHTLFTP